MLNNNANNIPRDSGAQNLLIGNTMDDFSNPRKEHFCKFLKIYCCPSFSVKSFVFLVSVFNLCLYIATLAYGIEDTPKYFLRPKLSGFLIKLLQKDKIKIKEDYQVWRLVTYMFIHYDIIHITLNTISLFIIGFAVERIMKVYKFIGLYLLSGFGAIILSTVSSPNYGAGASGAIFGVFGSFVFF
jgi:membrane associated rhomboid family serine protease